MDHAAINDITDVQTLRAMLVERDQAIASHQQAIVRHERTLVERDTRIAWLVAEVARLRRLQFAARSEKMDPAQRALFEGKRPVTTPSATQVWSTALSSFPRGEGRWVYWEGRRVR